MYRRRGFIVVCLVVVVGFADSLIAEPVPHVFVANEKIPNAIRENDPVTNAFVRSYDNPSWSTDGAGRFIAFDRQDHLWATDNGSSRIYELGNDGTQISSWTVPAYHGMNDIEYHPGNDRLYLVVRTGGSGTAQHLREINPHDGSQVERVSWTSEFEPNYIGVASDGNIYVTRWALGADAVRVYDPTTFSLIRSVAPPTPHADAIFSGLAFVGDHFYLAAIDRHTAGSAWIDEYDLASGLWQRTVGSYNGLAGLERASDNSLWAVGVSDQAQAAEIDIPSGDILRLLGEDGPSSIGNQDVEVGMIPEPSSLTLALLGVGLISRALLRRR